MSKTELDLTKVWMDDSTRTRMLTKAAQSISLSVRPRLVNLAEAVKGDVIHQVFTVVNRGNGVARFKVFLTDITPHHKNCNHAFVHYSPAGVTAYPSLPTHFTVSFHANIAGTYANTIVVQTEAKEIKVKFKARVSPPATHIARFKRCWPDTAIPMNLGPEELLDYKLMPRLPMCCWDFDQEKMRTVDEALTLSAKEREAKKKDPNEAKFFYAVHPRRSIQELERKVERRKDRYAHRLQATITFPSRISLFRDSDLTGDQVLQTVPQMAVAAPLPVTGGFKRF